MPLSAIPPERGSGRRERGKGGIGEPMQATSEYRPKLWVPGDWNAFFGLGTNVLLNVLVLSGLMLFVIKLPGDTIVYGRILPALAIALPLGNIWYAYLAYRLSQREGRDTVAA